MLLLSAEGGSRMGRHTPHSCAQHLFPIKASSSDEHKSFHAGMESDYRFTCSVVVSISPFFRVTHFRACAA